MAKVDNDYLIEGYFSGTLTEEEETLFREKMENDPDFAQTVKDLEMLENGLNALGFDEIAKDIGDWEVNYQSKHALTQRIPRAMYTRYASIAASVLVLIGVAFFLNNRVAKQANPSDVFTEYYEPYENMIASREQAFQSDSLLESAMEAYEAGSYELAIKKLEEYTTIEENDLRPYLYIGISQMELGKHQEADKNFVKAMALKLYRQQAEWYRILNFLKAEDITSAIKYINEVKLETPDHYRIKEMGKMLKIL